MKWYALLLFVCLGAVSGAQELFPSQETANTIAKGTLDLKMANEFYNDASRFRSWQGYSFYYGLTSSLTISQMFSFSNHHGYFLPNDFIQPAGQGIYSTNGYVPGRDEPYTFENFTIGLKWRFLKRDAEKRHIRLGAYLNLAPGNEPHMAAEASLDGDNSGIATGLIATLLQHRFASSVMVGVIIPHIYLQSFDTVEIKYGNAINYSLSLGYLLLPTSYKNYKQTNINIYFEIVGESYDAAMVYKNNIEVSTANALSLKSGNYLEGRPAIQFILHSNTRIDASLSFLLAGVTYERSYPAYFFNVRHTFYL